MNLVFMNSRVGSIIKKTLVINTLWMLLAQGLRLSLQAFYFVIIARTLGAEQYGAFVGATALVGILSPFASLGIGNLLIKNISRNRVLFQEYWGNALFIIFVCGTALTALLLCFKPLILPQKILLLLVFLVAITDLIFARIIDTAGKAFQAVQRLSGTSLITTLPNLTRVAAAIAVVYFFPTLSALEWTFFYLISTGFAALVAVLIIHRELGYPKLALSRIKPEFVEGILFSVNISGRGINNKIDKVMLSHIASLGATGIYAAAYRFIDVVLTPVRSVLSATYARFFQQGEAGISGSLNLARRISPIAGLYGATAGLGLFLLAPLIPYILGDKYATAIEALRWLAPLPFFKTMHFFASDTLSGAGFQGVRSVMTLISSLFNVLLNLWLIPLYSWKGAAWSILVSDCLLMVGLWGAVFFLYRREIRQRRMVNKNKNVIQTALEKMD